MSFDNVIPKIFLHMEIVSSQPSFLLPPLSVFYSHWSFGFWRERVREKEIYIYSVFSLLFPMFIYTLPLPRTYIQVYLNLTG